MVPIMQGFVCAKFVGWENPSGRFDLQTSDFSQNS
jgi:hypothetical protein